MAKIIKFQEYMETRNKEKMCGKRMAVLPEGSRKTEEAAGETMEAGRRSPYILAERMAGNAKDILEYGRWQTTEGISGSIS